MGNGLKGLLSVVLGLAVGLLLFGAMPQAHALPEYGTRTGEPCATCHVNPAGGGPRTARGALWIAAGKPDKVPLAVGGAPAGRAPAAARGPAATDESANAAPIYAQAGCAACHGPAGEGGSGPALNQRALPADQVSYLIRNGGGNMPA